MRQKIAYRQLTEAEKRYIDRLVNEAWTDSVKNFGNTMKDFVGDLRNSARKGYDNFHKVLNGQKPDRNPTNMSPWEVQWKNAYNNDRFNGVPTDRSQWSQLNDFIADIVTNGQHSQRKNALLNQQMQRDMQMNGNNPYWEKKVFDYWASQYNQMKPGKLAADDWTQYMRNASNYAVYYNKNLYNYLRDNYGETNISYEEGINYKEIENKWLENAFNFWIKSYANYCDNGDEAEENFADYMHRLYNIYSTRRSQLNGDKGKLLDGLRQYIKSEFGRKNFSFNAFLQWINNPQNSQPNNQTQNQTPNNQSNNQTQPTQNPNNQQNNQTQPNNQTGTTVNNPYQYQTTSW